jgi:RNA 3'-terminal phosphate cyclase-like protein
MEILRRGVVDSVSQSVAILFMALGPEDVSKIRVGKLTEYTYVERILALRSRLFVPKLF